MRDKTEFIERLNQFKAYEEGWIEGGRKLNSDVAKYTEEMIDQIPLEILDRWSFSIFVNGSMLWSLDRDEEDKRACINVAGLSMSAFVELKDKVFKTWEHEIHGIEDIMKTFNEINEILGVKDASNGQ